MSRLCDFLSPPLVSRITEQSDLDAGNALDHRNLGDAITESLKPRLVQVVAALVEVMDDLVHEQILA